MTGFPSVHTIALLAITCLRKPAQALALQKFLRDRQPSEGGGKWVSRWSILEKIVRTRLMGRGGGENWQITALPSVPFSMH
jgi:hypothetical protein